MSRPCAGAALPVACALHRCWALLSCCSAGCMCAAPLLGLAQLLLSRCPPPCSANATYMDTVSIKGQPPAQGPTVELLEFVPCSTLIKRVTTSFASGAALGNVLKAASDAGAAQALAGARTFMQQTGTCSASEALTCPDAPPLPFPATPCLAGSPEAICNAALFACPGELFPYPSMLACISFLSARPAICYDGVHTLQVWPPSMCAVGGTWQQSPMTTSRHAEMPPATCTGYSGWLAAAPSTTRLC